MIAVVVMMVASPPSLSLNRFVLFGGGEDLERTAVATSPPNVAKCSLVGISVERVQALPSAQRLAGRKTSVRAATVRQASRSCATITI
jgi:hypothetical protein